MSEILDTLDMYLKLPFVQYALIVGTLIALSASLLGVTLVRSFSSITKENETVKSTRWFSHCRCWRRKTVRAWALQPLWNC